MQHNNDNSQLACGWQMLIGNAILHMSEIFSNDTKSNRNQSIMKSRLSVLQHFAKGVVLHLKKKAWIPFTQECFCAKFGLNQSHSPGEEHFKFCLCIFAISLFSPWKRTCPSFEQTWFPSTLGCFVPSLVEIGTWFRRRFSNFVNVFSLFRYHPSLFQQIRSPFTKGCFVLSFFEIGQVVLGKTIFQFRQCIFVILFLLGLWK